MSPPGSVGGLAPGAGELREEAVGGGSVIILTHGLWRSLVSALDWGSRGREFKSPQPDHQKPLYLGAVA